MIEWTEIRSSIEILHHIFPFKAIYISFTNASQSNKFWIYFSLLFSSSFVRYVLCVVYSKSLQIARIQSKSDPFSIEIQSESNKHSAHTVRSTVYNVRHHSTSSYISRIQFCVRCNPSVEMIWPRRKAKNRSFRCISVFIHRIDETNTHPMCIVMRNYKFVLDLSISS